MADEVFALSPISARAVQPSEADYDAIKEAFMETSRGRWFLGEYAKRNRNADTSMVLDAVARIEEAIAAQKKPVRDPLLDEALASLRAALAEAREATAAAVNDLAIEQNLAPVRKGARVIREIAWRLREIGADGRICDLIDSQVTAIEGAAAKLAPSDLTSALTGAFDRIEDKIAAFDADEAAAASPAPPKATPEVPDGTPVAETQAEPGASAMMQASPVAPEAQAVAKPTSPAAANEPAMAASSETMSSATTSEPVDAFDASDEAVLDMVAMEMAAPDTDEAYEPRLEDAEVYERQIQQSLNGANQLQQHRVHENKAEAAQGDNTPASVSSWEIDVTFATDTDTAAAAVASAALPAMPRPAPAPETVFMPTPAPAPSLGASLLENGIVTRPRPQGPDPLAPIRRMSQNEKIAFFS
jgi:hypothetical protein